MKNPHCKYAALFLICKAFIAFFAPFVKKKLPFVNSGVPFRRSALASGRSCYKKRLHGKIHAARIYVQFYSYNFGPAATSALPVSFVVYFSKFLMKRPARSLAFSSHCAGFS